MRIYSAIPFLLLLLSGCATFKELQPVPPLQSDERGFIELRNDGENFLLKQDNKYFIKFPGPRDVNFYLVLQTSAKRAVHNYCTATFNDGQEPISMLADVAADQDSLSVFVIDTSVANYYWVIDKVPQDMLLNVRYRYVAKWRFDVENKYDLYRRTLADNSVDKREYEAMGPQYDFAAFDVASEQIKLQVKNKSLLEMKSELVKLEKYFPKNIAASHDTMYQRYVELGDDTKSELQFQTDYNTLLSVIKNERETKGNFVAFMNQSKEFEQFLSQKNQFRAPILTHFKSVFLNRLEEAFPLYDAQLRKKNDISIIDLKPPIGDVEKLYIACGQQLPSNLKEVRNYVNEFNIPAKWINDAEATYEAISSTMQQKSPWPGNSYYPEMISKLEKTKSENPEYNLNKFERYYNPNINSLLSDGIQNIKQKIGQRQTQFQKAADVVRQINELRPGNDYKGIIHILRANRDLAFLIDQYPDVDALLLKSQADNIREQLNAQDWKGTEAGLSILMNDQNYISPSKISAKRLQTVQSLESDLFERVKKLSYERIDNFTKNNETTINGVAALYADSSFLPVYILTFSSESPERVAQKNKTIEAYINEVKTIRFPEKAIRNIYQELTKAPRDHGVEKAHSILAHAKFYKGQDKSIRNIIDECDPTIAKPLIKAKEYRRVLVVPVNEAAMSSNEYMFRVNVKIPSEAKFPVYDINFKVPSAIAEKAGKTQWFTKILLNKKVVKTEGHMRIVAPSADNNYEAQITPVEISKDGENIIEVQFNYPSFQLFEVSVMAQVPIIRKN
jgi:hypothetical protein